MKFPSASPRGRWCAIHHLQHHTWARSQVLESQNWLIHGKRDGFSTSSGTKTDFRSEHFILDEKSLNNYRMFSWRIFILKWENLHVNIYILRFLLDNGPFFMFQLASSGMCHGHNPPYDHPNCLESCATCILQLKTCSPPSKDFVLILSEWSCPNELQLIITINYPCKLASMWKTRCCQTIFLGKLLVLHIYVCLPIVHPRVTHSSTQSWTWLLRFPKSSSNRTSALRQTKHHWARTGWK